VRKLSTSLRRLVVSSSTDFDAASTVCADCCETTGDLFDNWFDPIEAGLRERARELIQAMIEGEFDQVLARPRY
jgi:hypothetical protein